MEARLRQHLRGGKFQHVNSTHSRRMSAIRSSGNKTTERALRLGLVRAGVRGWQMNVRDLPGTPDFVFAHNQMAIFVDGCFWHGCAACSHAVKTNSAFWNAKIRRNKDRDMINTAALRAAGYRVLRIWEHAVVKDTARVVSQIIALLT